MMIKLLFIGSGCDEGSKPGFSSCCVPKAVRCGTHNRDNCGQCPFDVHPNGFVMVFSHWCNGDCKWQEGNLLIMDSYKLWVIQLNFIEKESEEKTFDIFSAGLAASVTGEILLFTNFKVIFGFLWVFRLNT